MGNFGEITLLEVEQIEILTGWSANSPPTLLLISLSFNREKLVIQVAHECRDQHNPVCPFVFVGGILELPPLSFLLKTRGAANAGEEVLSLKKKHIKWRQQ